MLDAPSHYGYHVASVQWETATTVPTNQCVTLECYFHGVHLASFWVGCCSRLDAPWCHFVKSHLGPTHKGRESGDTSQILGLVEVLKAYVCNCRMQIEKWNVIVISSHGTWDNHFVALIVVSPLTDPQLAMNPYSTLTHTHHTHVTHTHTHHTHHIQSHSQNMSYTHVTSHTHQVTRHTPRHTNTHTHS